MIQIVRQLPEFGPAAETEFRRRYLRRVTEKLKTLELIGIPGRFSPQTTLSVAYISLSVSMASRSVRRRGIDPARFADWREDTDDTDQTAVQVETALGGSRLTLIRGEAGAGKSTLLRWLASTAARSGFEADLVEWNGCVPFLIKLRDYPDGDLPGPERFLEKIAKPISGTMPDRWVHRQLESGRAILLVDGVDELVEKRRRAVRTWLSELLSEYPRIRVVVTSRPSAVRSKWLETEGFQPAFLEPLGRKGIKALIRQWHEAMQDAGDSQWSREQLSGCERRLLAELRAKAHLCKLVSTPLLAAMLCALNLDRNTKLPDGRMDLEIPSYEEIVLEEQQKEHLLRILAYKLTEDGRSELSRFTAECLIQKEVAKMLRMPVSANAVLDYLLVRSGVLREPADDQLVATPTSTSGARPSSWRRDTRGPFQERLLRGLLDRIRTEPRSARALKLLLATCQETLLIIPPDLRPEIEQCLAELVPPRSLAVAQSLAVVGEPILDWLPVSLEGLSVMAKCPVGLQQFLSSGPRRNTPRIPASPERYDT